YLGSRVAALWQAVGYRVFVTTRSQTKAELFRSRGWHPILCDITVAGTLSQLPRVDALLTAFALDRTTGVAMRDVYVEGMINLVTTVAPPGRWLHVSSSSVYGQTDGSWIDEDASTGPLEPAGQIVVEAENALRRGCPDAIVLRFSGIYGPGRLLRRKSIE